MEELKITKWGNSNGLRIPKNVMEYLKVTTNDFVKIEKEDVNGIRRLIIEAIPDPHHQEMTIQELFAGYDVKQIKTNLQEFAESVGDEKW